MQTTTDSMPTPRSGEGALPRLIARRFEVERVVRRTPAHLTLLARDRTTGDQVVVKAARSELIGRFTRIRLFHEADVLQALSRESVPGIVPLLDVGEGDGWLHLALPFVAGQTLAERLGKGRLPVDTALSVVEQLLRVLDAAHRRGVLHRDIKPSNLILAGAGSAQAGDVVVHVIDWGLARTDQLNPAIRDEPVGTAAYTSPEQAGLLRLDVDDRSDLYSVGALLHECLSGQPPFAGATVGEVLRQHLSAPPPDLRATAGVPSLLAALTQRLLAKEPRDRYQTAAGALADIVELRHRLAAGEREPDFVLATHDARRTLTEPLFVGRREEVRRLVGAAEEATTGHGGLLLVEAESGGGKSRLLEEMVARVPSGMLVLRGQGVDQAARPPYQLLDGVARDLAAHLADAPQRLARLRSELSPYAATLVQALPVLRAVFGDPDAPVGPEEFGEARTIAALTALLDAVGDQQRPALIVLDDCQWADDATVKLLARWAREAAATMRHVLVVTAFRSEEVGPDHLLRRASTRRLRLRPLGATDVELLVESMAGEIPAAAMDVVRTLGEGSPFLAAAVLRGLVEAGALQHDGERWRVDAEALAGAQSSRQAAGFLVRRLELLDGAMLRLLSAGAVIGKRFDVELAAGLAGWDVEQAQAALHQIRSRHIVWIDADAAAASFVHDKLREALLGRLPVRERQALHRAVAEHLQSGPDPSAYDLAFHFHAAGDDGAALPYALAAATEARARHSLTAAEQQYRIALGGLPAGDAATRFQVETGLGQTLMLQGRYAESETLLTAALDSAAGDVDRAQLELQLGELAFKRGAVPDSVARLEQGLRRLGRHVPARRFGFALWAVWEAFIQALHTLLPARLYQRRSLDGAQRELLAARIYSRLAYSYWFSKGREPTAWAHLREMNLLERYPATLELAQAYSEHAPVASTLPWFGRGEAYAEKSYAIRRDFGDVWGQGQSLHFYGVVLYAGSKFRAAIEKLTEAIRLLERTGDQWEINTALWHIGFSHYRLGELGAARAALSRCLTSAIEIGDHQARAIALSGLSKVSAGEIDPAEVEAALANCQGDLHTTGELITGKAIMLLRQDQPDAAARLLSDGYRQVVKAGVRNEYVAPMLPWLATSLRIAAEGVSAYSPGERRLLVRRAARAARRARLVAAAYRNNLPHALREQALIALLRGRRRRAERLVAKGIAVARRLDMTAERLVLEQLAERVAAGVEPPLPPLRPEPVEESTSLSLVDRFENLLTVGHTIATALTAESVYDAVGRAALELLRGEEATVVLVEDGPDAGRRGDGSGAPEEFRIRPLEASSSGQVAEGLIRRALLSGVTTWSAGDPDGDLERSGALLPLHVRSALAAPVFVRGRPVACWYVSHSRVGSLFGPEEEQLAEFVSTLAGAALENAEGFAEVRALSQGLERRVAERTEELQHANAELRRLDELKSEFVAMASHELRSPLTSMLGYCRTALRHWEKIDDARKREFFQTVERQGDRLATLVNDLLQMSRIESGALQTTLAPTLLRPILDEIAVDFGGRAPDLTIDCPPELAAIADEEHLRRIVINLVDNAVKYGGPPVQIRAVASGDRIRVHVRDHGDGVPEEFVPRLFERFAQASAGTTRRASGTGLGMSIVRGLAEAMAGSVTYQAPEDGAGAEFVVDLARAGT